MSSLVKVTPLCGARNEQPLCYLLEIDEACILLDCGWDETFDTRLLKPLLKIAHKIDAVLLTHCDLNHLGALPYAFAKAGMKAKVYATLPVLKMGQLTLYDTVQSRGDKEDFDVFSLADIDSAWDHFVQLRYQQSCMLGGKADGITVSPLNAGHMIGGALWKITKDSEEIVYAVDYNHAQERLLDGTVLSDLPRPSVLITDAYTVLDRPIQGGKRAREGMLIENIMRTITRGGNVLLPVDGTGRVLELMVILDQHWQAHNLKQYSLAFLSPESRSIVDMAASQTEWLSKHVSQQFVQNRTNIFHFSHLHRCCTRKELARLPGPQVVLASGLDLETSSFALDLFCEWAVVPQNTVLLTQRARAGSTAQRMIDLVLSNQAVPSQMAVQLCKRVALEGRELREYEEAEREKQREAKRKRDGEAEAEGEGEGGAGAGETVAEEATEGDTEMSGTQEAAATPKPAPAPAAAGREAKRHRGRGSEGRFAMFPHYEELNMFDEYGEVCDTSIYQREDQQEQIQAYVSETITFSGGTIDPEKDKQQAAPTMPVQAVVPTKPVVFNVKIARQCHVAFVDFGGRSDARSIHTILGHLKPSKVIIVHGSEACTEELHRFCIDKVTEPEQTYAPAVGDSVMASSDTNIYKVKLASDLAKSLQFVSVGGYDVAYVNAVIQMPEEPENAQQPTTAAKDKQMLTLALKPQSNTANAWKPFAFLGDVKLSDLREVLSKEGYKVDLKAGMLLVNSSIVIRKSGARMIFEGTLSDEYYSVRKLLLSQYSNL